MDDLPGSIGFLGEKVIWVNPPGLGHAFIKLRKQLLEEAIIERIKRRDAVEKRMAHKDADI